MKILLAIDGSEQSEAGVDEVVNRHFPADTEVRVISVVEPPYYPTAYPWNGDDMEFYDRLKTSAREMAEAVTVKAAAKIRADEENRQLIITTDVISGSPKEVILEEAEKFGADLIVVGSHGHGMVERFLLGSVSNAVALHAACSVEIVRSRKRRTSESKKQ